MGIKIVMLKEFSKDLGTVLSKYDTTKEETLAQMLEE